MDRVGVGAQLQARPAAIEEAEAQMEQATALETEAQEFVDALGEEVRSELEARRAEQLQAAIRAVAGTVGWSDAAMSVWPLTAAAEPRGPAKSCAPR